MTADKLHATGGAAEQRTGQRLRALRIVGIAFVAVLMLTWVFLRSDAVSTREHQAYVLKLHTLRNVDAQIGLTVLANRLGLPHHFDDIVQSLADARAHAQELHTTPAFLSDGHRQNLLAQLRAYEATIDRRTELIDTYKRETTTFENSVNFFPDLIEQARTDASLAPAQRNAIDAFGRHLMEFITTDDPELARALGTELRALEHGSSNASPTLQATIAHARVMLDGKVALDGVTRAIIETPSDQQVAALAGAYALAFDDARVRARLYATTLYAASVLLGLYLLVVLLKLNRASHELRAANIDLQDKIEALNRSQEQLRLYANVFTNATEGMTITDADARIVAVNPAFSEITGYAEEDILGKTPASCRGCPLRHTR